MSTTPVTRSILITDQEAPSLDIALVSVTVTRDLISTQPNGRKVFNLLVQVASEHGAIGNVGIQNADTGIAAFGHAGTHDPRTIRVGQTTDEE